MEEVAEKMLELMRFSINGGRARPAIMMFAPEGQANSFRCWNRMIVQYAGYEDEDGNLIGNRKEIGFTKVRSFAKTKDCR